VANRPPAGLSRYFDTFKIFACDNFPREDYGGLSDHAILTDWLRVQELLPAGASCEVVPVKCERQSYWLVYHVMLAAQRALAEGAWPGVEYVLFTEPDQRVELSVAHAKGMYARLDSGAYLVPHRLEELWDG
jgi:hypothetical protein